MRRITVFLVLIVLTPLVSAQSNNREQRLIDHARYCIVNDIVLSSIEPKSNQANGVSCRAGELGLAFIGEKSSKKANAELVKLRRYVLDGALGESYTCYVLSKGNRVLSAMTHMDFVEERNICEADVSQRLRELGIAVKDINVDAICAKPTDVRSWIKDISSAVKSRRKCNPQDW